MSTATVTDARPAEAPRFVERLHFVTNEHEHVKAFDLVYALTGVCQAIDRHPLGLADDIDAHEVHNRLATAARLLAEQLEERIEHEHKPRHRQPRGGVR